MTDYISRQKVVDALRANQEICLKSDAYANDSIDNYTLAVIDIDILTVEDLPAAPVREVVLCKECRYWYNAPAADGYNSCEIDALIRHEDFFCANGER